MERGCQPSRRAGERVSPGFIFCVFLLVLVLRLELCGLRSESATATPPGVRAGWLHCFRSHFNSNVLTHPARGRLP